MTFGCMCAVYLDSESACSVSGGGEGGGGGLAKPKSDTGTFGKDRLDLSSVRVQKAESRF